MPASPTVASSFSTAYPAARTWASARVSAWRVVFVRPVSGARSAAEGGGALRRGQARHDRVAERAGVPRDRRADLQDLHGVVRAEHVVQHDHAAAGQRGHPDRLAGLPRERLGPAQRPDPQLGAVQVGVAELEHAGAEAVLAGLRVLGDELVCLQGAQQPVYRRLGEAKAGGDLGDAEARRAGAEHAEDLRRALHRLDHRTLSAQRDSTQRSNWRTIFRIGHVTGSATGRDRAGIA